MFGLYALSLSLSASYGNAFENSMALINFKWICKYLVAKMTLSMVWFGEGKLILETIKRSKLPYDFYLLFWVDDKNQHLKAYTSFIPRKLHEIYSYSLVPLNMSCLGWLAGFFFALSFKTVSMTFVTVVIYASIRWFYNHSPFPPKNSCFIKFKCWLSKSLCFHENKCATMKNYDYPFLAWCSFSGLLSENPFDKLIYTSNGFLVNRLNR